MYLYIFTNTALVVGVVLIGLAILASNARGLMEVAFVLIGTLNGPILGVFLIGFFLPNCNLKGVWTGFIGSFVLTLWLAIGGMLYRKKTNMLPFSVEECLHLNYSSVSNSSIQETVNSTYSSYIEDTNVDTSFINSFYQISYTLYGTIGPVLCILIAVVVSCLTGNQRIEEVSPKYVSSSVHKFFWTKEQTKHNKTK
ncbi:Sodium-coupled monocarboxylate transporter 2 [Armadillidium nasatum]|uniref:Sodium-coupled monocarboxylate transporter 2 n=1 Tax=Armadillidium nasatum TaxID=96803 RepID=A0A5N5T480_9CRUS|nr:Sodium-coupled monocarboxylate transporter 2 [Armadillidium nasatum]